MTETLFYVCLDTLATSEEIFMLYLCTAAFCRRCEKKALEVLPYIVMVILTCVLTWIVPLGTLKVILTAAVFFILQRLILKEAWYKLIGLYSLYLILLVLNDVISLILTATAFGHTSRIYGDIVVNIWPYYLIKLGMLSGIIFCLYKIFQDYAYEMQSKDAAVLFLYSIFTYAVTYISIGRGFFSGNVNWFDSTIAICCALFGCLLLLMFLYLKNSSYLKHQRETAQQKVRELEAIHAYYEQKLKDEERVRAIYHDFKNHLLILQGEKKGSEPLQEMTEYLQKQISDFENYQRTGNPFLDTIISDKAKKANEQGIDFSAVIQFESGSFLAPLDISTIFGNAIDNALEASMTLPQDQRLITIKAGRIHDMLVIVFKNHVLPEKNQGTDTGKKDLFLHGFGLKNIRQAVEAYDGQMTVSQDQSAFILKIVIPIP